jgi:pimeloyl-ACP methyl ester carboxylesterase
MSLDISVPVADQVSLHVRHWPGVQPRAFLLLHGLTSNARMWDDVACRLATRGYPVYAVDLRGHGESDRPGDGHDTATAAADLTRVGAALGLSGVVAAGRSWGASVALRLAAENPELVGGLALLDGGCGDVTAAGPAVALRQDSLFPGPDDLSAPDDLPAPGGVAAARPDDARHQSVVRSLRDEPLARWYPLVNVPVMLLPVLPEAGTWEDDLRAWVKHAEAEMPQATTRWYEDNGHQARAECPERITNDLIDLAGETGFQLFV